MIEKLGEITLIVLVSGVIITALIYAYFPIITVWGMGISGLMLASLGIGFIFGYVVND
jgi:hypothetical protein